VTQRRIDFARFFDDILAIARRARSPSSGWARMCARATTEIGAMAIAPLLQLDLGEDARDLRRIVAGIRRREPIPRGVDTLLFGLFDALGEDGQPETGFYVAGVRGFDPADGDSLCEPAWWPDARYIGLDTLDVLHRTALASRNKQHKQLLDNTLRLGAAALLGRFSAGRVGLRIVVAFDDGDFAEITAARRATASRAGSAQPRRRRRSLPARSHT
jgi:hypothetical protein